MKKLKSIILLLLVGFSGYFLKAQTIYTADNNPGAVGGVNVFTGATALQDAIDPAINTALLPGDIIHVTRSSINYGTITVPFQLNIFGIGLDPDTDGNERSRVDTINIEDPVASGTRISGLWMQNDGVINLGGVAGALNNLLIENSNIEEIQHISNATTLTNLIIRNNVLGRNLGLTNEAVDLILNFHSNVIIANNIIHTPNLDAGGDGAISANNGTSVENNIFLSGDPDEHAFENFNGNTVKNNIFYGVIVVHTGLSNNVFENNLSFSAANNSFPSTNGNQSFNNIVNQDPLFANLPQTGAVDFSTFDPTLQVGSPAIGSGEGGTDMGVFGGPAPFDREGTLIPLIESLTLPSLILKGNDLQVQIKAKGN